MKRIISIVLIICSLKCISLYTQTTGMYSIADNHDKHTEASASICGIQGSYDFHFPFDRMIAEVELEEEHDEKISNEPYKEPDKETLKEQAVLAYHEFVDGRRSIGSSNIYSLAMPTGEPDRRYHTMYAIIDSNGDDIPELNIKSGSKLKIFDFENGELSWFKSIELGNMYQVYLLQNGAYMTYSDRFSECSYSYFELDKSGNEINGLYFYWEENNGNYIPDEEDDFFFNGNACTMEEWHDTTREYLYTDEDGREQIRNQVEWTLYCEADPFEIDAVNKEERTLILLDIFKEGILHQEITRDFSRTADPMSAIISVEMIDSENIRLEYYKGETYTIESEIVGVVYNG